MLWDRYVWRRKRGKPIERVALRLICGFGLEMCRRQRHEDAGWVRRPFGTFAVRGIGRDRITG
jgi:hypothetical protein